MSSGFEVDLREQGRKCGGDEEKNCNRGRILDEDLRLESTR